MRFRTVRPHEDRPLRPGARTGSVLVAFHTQPGVDVEAVMAEVETLIRRLLDEWYAERGRELLEAVPDVA